ncbi:MAG: MATE family efflux transporter [Eubacterium sp.]
MFERSSQLVNRKFREYLIPTTLSGVSMMLGIIVDGIIVGMTIGPDAMAAVSVGDPIVLLYQTIFFLFGMGGATLVSILKGEHNNPKADTSYTVSCLLLLISSVVILILGQIFLDNLVGIICNDQSLFDFTHAYVRVLLWGAPFMIFVPGMVYFIRVDGQPKLSANILLIANIVNLVMDLVYIKIFNFGIGGAALATVTGYIVGFIFILKYWFSKKRTLHFIKIQYNDFKLTTEISNSGLAGAVNTLLLGLKTLCINLIVMAASGADGMAVFAVCNFAISFVSMFIVGTSDTMVPLLGMLYGEKDWQGIRFLLKQAFTVVLISCGISVALMELFPVQILALFNVTSTVQVSLGIPALRIFAFSLIGVGISYTMMYYLQTTKHRNISVTISVLRGFALIVPCVWIFSRFLGLAGILSAYVIAETLTILITLILCKRAVLKSKGKYSGIFLYEKPTEEALYDVTIHSQIEDAVTISDQLIDFACTHGIDPTTSNLVGLMAEEAVVNITSYNRGEKPLEIDIACRIKPEFIFLSLRDDGKPFDMMTVSPKEKDHFQCDSITIINKIAKNVDYARMIGLNNTVIMLERKEDSNEL